MIRKQTRQGWILFNQHDHARLAADIMILWGNSGYEKFSPYEEVLFAIEQHDNGWIEWDALPRVNPGNNYPMNFMEMDLPDQHEIWSKSFSRYSGEHPYASALIALHFRKFNCKSVARDPQNGIALDMKKSMDQFICDTLGLDYFESVDDLPPEVQTNLRFLQIGDIISLTLCHGWKSMKLDNVPSDYKNTKSRMVLGSDNGKQYHITPTPFSDNELEFTIRGKKIDQKEFRNDSELRSVINDTEFENFSYIIHTP